jgi:hypothetical protein
MKLPKGVIKHLKILIDGPVPISSIPKNTAKAMIYRGLISRIIFTETYELTPSGLNATNRGFFEVL